MVYQFGVTSRGGSPPASGRPPWTNPNQANNLRLHFLRIVNGHPPPVRDASYAKYRFPWSGDTSSSTSFPLVFACEWPVLGLAHVDGNMSRLCGFVPLLLMSRVAAGYIARASQTRLLVSLLPRIRARLATRQKDKAPAAHLSWSAMLSRYQILTSTDSTPALPSPFRKRHG
jgi:hypothetical protein